MTNRLNVKIEWRGGIPYVRIGDTVKPVARNLLAEGDSNTKTRKNDTITYTTKSLSLAPHKQSGIGNLCAFASKGCSDACLFGTGKGFLESVRLARIRKTGLWYLERKWFLDRLQFEIQRAYDRASEECKKLAVRLNVFSDVAWECHGIIDAFPEVAYYDYSKDPRRAGQLRPNYWVTFSRSENNELDCLDVLRKNGTVATVYDDGYTTGARNLHGNGPLRMPKRWRGFKTVNGDETDLRFTDPSRHAIMLKLKARTLNDRKDAIASGFATKGVAM